MEVVRSQRRQAIDNTAASLPLYRSFPEDLECRLEEFELYAVDRLRVLKGISDGLARGKNPEEMEKLVNELWKANMRHQDPSEILNKDIISHFALGLLIARRGVEDSRKWFLLMETTLFKHRFRRESLESQRMLLSDLNFSYKALGHAEFETLKDKFIQVARSIGQSAEVDSIYFKVPFQDVPDLVAGHRVLLLKGFAYVAMSQVASIVVSLFRSKLSEALVKTSSLMPNFEKEEKERMAPFTEALSTSYLGPDYSQPKEFSEISLRDLQELAHSSFPLCMRHLFEKLREDHHLKHGGRMQLGLFLKGVGLKLEDALAFWKAEFTHKVGAEQFDKQYAYSIRHNYGKEGKRTDYTPYSCQKIISSTPGVGDHHGCPYKHFSEENLRAALSKMGVGGRTMDEVMDKVRNRHYQLACTLTFEAIHSSSCDTGINHPNQYFVESRKVLQPKSESRLQADPLPIRKL